MADFGEQYFQKQDLIKKKRSATPLPLTPSIKKYARQKNPPCRFCGLLTEQNGKIEFSRKRPTLESNISKKKT
jgi:hypothetical protein